MPKKKPPRFKKKEEEPARIERHVRVTFFLVAHTQPEVNAVREVIRYLLSQYFCLLLDREWKLPVTGFTHSVIHDVALQKDPIFIGHWWSGYKAGLPMLELLELSELAEENVVLFIIDLPAVAKEWRIDEGIEWLKEDIFSIYKKHRRPQEEIWMVKQDIYRYT